jgi:hypothetical protein
MIDELKLSFEEVLTVHKALCQIDVLNVDELVLNKKIESFLNEVQ